MTKLTLTTGKKVVVLEDIDVLVGLPLNSFVPMCDGGYVNLGHVVVMQRVR